MERFVSTELISSSFFYKYKCIPFHIVSSFCLCCLFVFFDVRRYRDTIVGQMKRMGSSLDWSREAFTMDQV